MHAELFSSIQKHIKNWLFDQLWDWADGDCITDCLPDQLPRNTEEKLWYQVEMVMIKLWSWDKVGRYAGFDRTCTFAMFSAILVVAHRPLWARLV